MLASLRKRIEREDEGFTLIELMVVVLIIAILLAIAIPTFLGARERAQNRAAQSNIRNGYAAQKVFYTDAQVFTTLAATLKEIEPSLDFVTGAALAKDNQVKVQIGNNQSGAVAQVVCVSSAAQTGNIYSLREIATGPNAGVAYFADTSATPAYPVACDATGAVNGVGGNGFTLTKW